MKVAICIALTACLACTSVIAQTSTPDTGNVETGPDDDSASPSTAGQTATEATKQAADNTPPAITATIISRDVEVLEGDTLSSIAKRELGKAGFAPQLAEFNGLVSNAPLTPGDIIRIPIQVPARGEFAEVVFVKGEARATRIENQPNGDAARETVIELQRDMEVHTGDALFTGSDGYVSIEFSSGSVINMQPDTEAILTRLNCLPSDSSCVIEVRALKGRVTSDVDIRENQPVDFRIQTPYASAAVRGTVFDVDAGQTLLVGVTEGAVDLSTQQAAVDLESGFGSVVEEGQAPSEPIPLLPAPVFKRVPARVAPGDAITWWAFADAASYGARLAADEFGIQTLASYQVNDDQIGFDSVETGDYFLLLRAIDNNGLRGFVSNTRITIAQIDDSIAPVATTVTRQGSEFLVEIQDLPEEAVGYEIQISTNEIFDDPLSVDVNTTGTAVFRIDDDLVFSRARVLMDPYTVSAFGDIASSDN